MGRTFGLGGRSWKKPAMMAGVLGLAGLAVCWGRSGSLPRAGAVPPVAQAPNTPPPPAPAAASSDYSHRVVAYIYHNIPVTREELGEFLIAREGAEKVKLLVNKRIIEHACREKGIEVTAAEVEAALQDDLRNMGVNRTEFLDKVLKHYNKTLYEWKEDVLRPKLLMGKMVRNRVKLTEQDLKDCFEAYYGEKIACRIIMWPKDEKRVAMQQYEEIRKSEENFARAARSQASAKLAASGGRITPIAHHATGDDTLEKEAFSLQPGELSGLIQTREGTVVIKCDQRIPADTSKKLEGERANLEKEVLDKKISAEIPVLFAELAKQADPKYFLQAPMTEDELKEQVKKELNSDPLTRDHGPAPTPPHGN